MPLSEHYRTAIDEFFAESAAFAEAYTHQTFRYAAVRGKEGLALIQAVLALDVGPRRDTARLYENDDVICEEVALEDLDLTPRGLVEALLKGSVATQKRTLIFPADNPGSYSVFHNPFDGTTSEEHGFASRLQVNGANDVWHFTQPPGIHRQIRAGSPPYDGLGHLGSDFGLRLDQGLVRAFEIRTSRVALISDVSRVHAGIAEIEIILPKVLQPSMVRLGLRIAAPKMKEIGTSRSGDEIQWADDGDQWRGHVTLNAELDSEVSCTLSYGGIPQHDCELVDPDRRINSLRVAYEVFDRNADVLKQVIDNRVIKNRRPLNLELTVGALLALRGFRTIQLDQLPTLGDGPDILASDQAGNMLVVECATDVPEATEKLSKLHRRARAIRRAFADRNRGDIGVAPVLAVAQFRDDLPFALKQAEAHGILVWTAEDLEELRAFQGPPDAVEFFQELSQTRAYLLKAAMDDDASDAFG